MKDIASIAIRRQSISSEENKGIFQSLKSVHNAYRNILELMGRHKGRKLLMSYEKILNAPVEAVSAIADFVGIKNKELINQATSVIQRNRPEYLDLTRNDKVYGVVFPIKNHLVEGWAAYSKVTIGRPVVDLYIGDELIADDIADKYVDNDRVVHKTPEIKRDPGIRTCYSRAIKVYDRKIGFSIKLPEKIEVGDQISVRSTHNGEKLLGIPVLPN